MRPYLSRSRVAFSPRISRISYAAFAADGPICLADFSSETGFFREVRAYGGER